VGKGHRKRERDHLQVTEDASLAQRHDLSGGLLGHDPWTWGQDVSEALALSVPVVYACTSLIADSVAEAEWGEWRGTLQLPPSRIVRRPAQSMTRREWTWLVSYFLALYSMAPVILRGGLDSEGVPNSVVPYHPSRLSYADGAWFLDGAPVTDEVRVIRRTVIPTTDWRTASVLHLARIQVAAAMAAQEYAADWWVSGGAPVTVITTDQELTDPQADGIATRWSERRKLGPGTSPAVLGKGAKVATLGADAAAEGAMGAQDRIGADIARYFRIPPHLVNVPNLASSLTYANTESASTDLVRYTLNAYAGPIADFLSELLPGDYLTGRQVRLDLRALTRAEFESRTRGYESAIRAGWLSKDEVREYEGLPPQEGGTPSDVLAPFDVEAPTP